MAIKRVQHQTAHLTILIAYSLFCFAALGIEHPIVRFVASIGTVLPILWAVWVLSYARVPAETMAERLREERKHNTAGSQYRRITTELLAMCSDASQLDKITAEIEMGRLSREDGFRRLSRIELQMKRRVETIGELAAVSLRPSR